MNSNDLISYLGKKRFDSLNASERTLKRVLKSAPNLPTAAIWLLQQCQIQPTETDLKRWSEDVAKLKVKPVKGSAGQPARSATPARSASLSDAGEALQAGEVKPPAV